MFQLIDVRNYEYRKMYTRLKATALCENASHL